MKSSAVLKAQVESALSDRFAASLTLRQRPAPGLVSFGIRELDALAGGLPRGAITEICGPASSGRTSLLAAVLAEAAAREEVCALVDTGDALDPASAAAAGVDLDRLLWVRCGGNPEHALAALDMIIQAGGFGCVVLDLADVPPRIARRIPLASWFRLRRAIENTSAMLLVLEQEPTVKTCASLILEMSRRGTAWSGTPGCSQLLRGLRVETAARKPPLAQTAVFDARAVG